LTRLVWIGQKSVLGNFSPATPNGQGINIEYEAEKEPSFLRARGDCGAFVVYELALQATDLDISILSLRMKLTVATLYRCLELGIVSEGELTDSGKKECSHMQNISLSIPDDIVFEVKSLLNTGATINTKLQLSLAIGMFVSQEISLAKAAQLAGKNLADFMSILRELSIPAFSYTKDMLEDDLTFLERK